MAAAAREDEEDVGVRGRRGFEERPDGDERVVGRVDDERRYFYARDDAQGTRAKAGKEKNRPAPHKARPKHDLLLRRNCLLCRLRHTGLLEGIVPLYRAHRTKHR